MLFFVFFCRDILLKIGQRWIGVSHLLKRVVDIMTKHDFLLWVWNQRLKPCRSRYLWVILLCTKYTAFLPRTRYFLQQKILTEFNLFGQFDALLSENQSNYKDVENKFKTLSQRMSNELAKILHCLEDLGILCAYEVFIKLSLRGKSCAIQKKKGKLLFNGILKLT